MTERRSVYHVRRTDTNQQEVMDALRAAHYLVVDTHTLGKGFPDLVVSRHGHIFLLEVKTRDGKLTEDERRFISDGWPVLVVISGQDAINKMRDALELKEY